MDAAVFCTAATHHPMQASCGALGPRARHLLWSAEARLFHAMSRTLAAPALLQSESCPMWAPRLAALAAHRGDLCGCLACVVSVLRIAPWRAAAPPRPRPAAQAPAAAPAVAAGARGRRSQRRGRREPRGSRWRPAPLGSRRWKQQPRASGLRLPRARQAAWPHGAASSCWRTDHQRCACQSQQGGPAPS